MRKQILAGAMALALATGMTTSAMAFGHGGASFHGGRFQSGAIHGGGFHTNRFDGIRSFGGARGGYVRGHSGGGRYGYGRGYPDDAYAADVGLVGLGLGLAEAATGYCGPYDYSYGACGAPAYYSYGPAYSGYGTPIDASSW